MLQLCDVHVLVYLQHRWCWGCHAYGHKYGITVFRVTNKLHTQELSFACRRLLFPIQLLYVFHRCTNTCSV